MSQAVRDLQPQPLWNAFANLNAVPRPSKKEARVTEFAAGFGRQLGLETLTDETGNVLIRKPATAGMENRPVVVMQSHLDMVCQKNSGTRFDFENEGIRMRIEGDWVHAEGTTLGADNGIGVAATMAVLESTDLAHPPIEALFTVDEETGMTGAKRLRGDWLKGRLLLNLDTEEDTELTIGCAGGVDVSASAEYAPQPVPSGWVARRISVHGLTGGHSGMDIHLGRGNANKLMNRILALALRESGGRVAGLDGGGLRNAIPRESTAVVVLAGEQTGRLEGQVRATETLLRHEYAVTDPGLAVSIEELAVPPGCLPGPVEAALLSTIDGVISGIWRMSPAIPTLVQTSNNLARVIAGDGRIQIQCLTRSSVDSERHELARILCSVFAVSGGSPETAGDYPGWQPEPESGIVQLMTATYRRLFGGDPHVAACHAGLECGIIGSHYPGMEMISFGPNIRGAHSPDEKVQISSVRKFWRYLTEVLASIR